jgi:phosphopantothenoylcysteine decarboxylase/phosphopantothenate--cysteine ligase
MAEREPLAGRRIAVYVSGSIAAYKACEVVSSLRQQGASVRVAMTEAGARFVSPMTFQSLSGQPVVVSVWSSAPGATPAPPDPAEGDHGMAHIALSAWVELQVACPASADLIARLALGLADDAVTATALASPAPLVVVPAMETGMWEHPATQAHVATLRQRGATVVGPTSGRLASGKAGAGRMVEPDDVVAAVVALLGARDGAADRWLAGRRVVVTAGGTREPIDAVRYIGNHSSGKMGLALVREALRAGATVTLVTAAPPPPAEAGLEIVEVSTAQAMLDAVRRSVPGANLLIMAAAVADYRAAQVASQKLKKQASGMHLDLVPTVDVLRELGNDEARRGMVVVGFAAETDDLVDNARSKLAAKGLDMIVANDVGAAGIGMGSEDNAVTILGRDGSVTEVARAPKAEVARRVLEAARPFVLAR